MADFSSGDTSPLKGPAPRALPEDISDLDKNDDAMPLTSPGDQAVQFIQGQPINGDAKVEIGDAPGTPAFVGLGKEELMKYANDPFWIKLRWFLFILFWVLWVAMLAGAIIIIVLAPKCAEKKNNPEAYYELDLKSFAKDGKLADLGNRANYLATLGMKSVIISDVLKKADGGTEDFKNVDTSLGTLAEFSEAVKMLKAEGLKVFLKFVPNHSGTKHEWFTNPDKYEDYYIRKPEADVASSVWKTVDNNAENAWAPDIGNDSYLQQFSKTADLNFRNEKVISEITGALNFWRGKGVDGFVLSAASYLIEDLGRLDDVTATKNQPENVAVIKKILNRRPEDPSMLVEVDDLNEADSKSYKESGIVLLTKQSDGISLIDKYSPLDAYVKLFKAVHGKEDAVLRLSRLQEIKSEETANILRLLAFTSNASVISSYGDELDSRSAGAPMDWETASTNGSTFAFLQKLVKVQQELVDDKEKIRFKYLDQPNNVFGFVRSEKYIVAVNVGSANTTVDFDILLENQEVKATVLVATPNAISLEIGDELIGKVTLPPKAGVALKVLEAAG